MGILPSETLATVRTALARSVNALEATGTASAATSVSLTDAAALGAYVSADRLKGKQVVVKTGTGAVSGNERLITASTTPGGVITVPTWGTTPAVDDTYDIYTPSIADKGLLDLAIKYAIEVAQDWHLIDWEDVASIVLGSVSLNGGFEDWTSGTAVAPDKWTATGTSVAVARESTLILPPFRYSAKLTNGASQVGTLQQQNTGLSYPWDLLGGQSVALSSIVYSTTASRVRLRLYDGTTTTNSAYHTGTGWETLSISSTALAAKLTELTTSLRIETGTAISAYAHDFRTVPSIQVYEYYVPKKFLRLAAIWSEWGTDFEWSSLVPQQVYSIDRSRERIVFDWRRWIPPGEFRCRLVGQTYQAVPSVDGDAIDLPLAYLVAMARSFILSMGRGSDDAVKQSAQVHAEAFRLRRQLHRQPMASSIRVR